MAVTLRTATSADLAALERLAQLDTQALPPGPHLVAERDGRIDAALSLSSGELIADPFRRTAELCELLRSHAGALRHSGEPAPAAPLEPRPTLLTA
jgi:hypothetical protein